jgi:ribosomal protein S25
MAAKEAGRTSLAHQFAILNSAVAEIQQTTNFTPDQIWKVREALTGAEVSNGKSATPLLETPRRRSPTHRESEFADTLARILGDQTMHTKVIMQVLRKERHPVMKVKFPGQAIASTVRKHPERFERKGRAIYRVRTDGNGSATVAAAPVKALPPKSKKAKGLRKASSKRAAKVLKKVPPYEDQKKVLKAMPATFRATDLAKKLGIDISQTRGIVHHLHDDGLISSKGTDEHGRAKIWRVTKKGQGEEA